jgi:transposase
MEATMEAIEYQFGAEEICSIKQYYKEQKDGRLKIRFLSLLMISQYIAIEQISLLLCVSPDTINRWFNLYREKGLDHLNVFNYKPKKQLLTDAQIAELVVWIKSISPQTLKEITCYIKEKFNVHYSFSGEHYVFPK